MRKLRVGIDAHMSVGAFRGMGRYARELVSQCDEEVLWLACAAQRSDPLVNHASGPELYPLWEQMVLPRLCRDLELDVLVCPYNTAPLRALGPTKLLLVVHDLIYLQPARTVPIGGSLYQLAGRAYRRFVVPPAVAHADAIITVSRFSAAELERNLGCMKPVFIVPNTVDESWFCAQPSAAPAAQDPFVLAVSGEAPHKNLQRVISAFAQARRSAHVPHGVRLRIAGVSRGATDSVRHKLERENVGDAVDILPYMPPDDMQALYRSASALLFPSLVEGFGIPVIEAMASGCPVITSDRGSLPEVAGDAALFVDPLATTEIASAIVRVLADRNLALALAAKGKANAERFHPRNVHPRMRDVWNSVRGICTHDQAA